MSWVDQAILQVHTPHNHSGSIYAYSYDTICFCCNPLTTIRYSLAQPAETELVVTDVYGRIVDRLAQGHKAAGVHTVQWDASGHPSGVYYYTLTSNKSRITKRMHLIK